LLSGSWQEEFVLSEREFIHCELIVEVSIPAFALIRPCAKYSSIQLLFWPA